MKLRRFIRKNRTEIDRVIRSACGNCRIDDDERELWIMNDEGLYLWAKSKGVDV